MRVSPLKINNNYLSPFITNNVSKDRIDELVYSLLNDESALYYQLPAGTEKCGRSKEHIERVRGQYVCQDRLLSISAP